MKRLLLLILFLTTVGLLAFLSERSQRGDELCIVDATPIRPITRVTITQPGSEVHFCSLCCARTWLDEHPEMIDIIKEGKGRITVVDEVSGEQLDATLAYWVESNRYSRRENKCRLHVFQEPDEAARHIFVNDGREIPGYLAGLGENLPWAAPFITEDLTGKKIDLKDYQGRIVFLRFWNSGNPFTVKDLGYLAKAHRRWQKHGFTVLAINVEQKREVVEAFISKQNLHDLPFPVLLDPQGKIADSYKVRGYPTGFLIDKSGIIRNQSIGEILPDLMQPLIEPLL